jgi:hypothetical protein
MESTDILLNFPSPTLFHLTKHNILFYSIEKGNMWDFRGGEDLFFHRAVLTNSETLYLDGASRLNKKIEHNGMLYKERKIDYVPHSNLGLVPLSLVAIGNNVYFVSSE